VLPIEDRKPVDVKLYDYQESKSAMRPLLRTKILLRLHQRRAQDKRMCCNLAANPDHNDYMSRSRREPKPFINNFISNAVLWLPTNQDTEISNEAHDSFSEDQESNKSQDLKYELSSLHDSCKKSENQETELNQAEASPWTLILVQDDHMNEETAINSVIDDTNELPETNFSVDSAMPIGANNVAVTGRSFGYKILSLKLQQKMWILID
jgi:hypothetical protein